MYIPKVGDRVRVTNEGVYYDVNPFLNEAGTICAVNGIEPAAMYGIVFDNAKFGHYPMGGFVARQLVPIE